MKRLFFSLCLILLASVTVKAQNEKAQYRNGQYLFCIKDGVLLRTGPGKNYPAVSDKDLKDKIILVEGFGTCLEGAGEEISASDDCREIDFSLKYLGKKQNGFLYVEGERDGDIFDNMTYRGWVPEKYIKAACPRCNGWRSEPEKDGSNNPFHYGEDYVKCTKCHGRGY